MNWGTKLKNRLLKKTYIHLQNAQSMFDYGDKKFDNNQYAKKQKVSEEYMKNLKEKNVTDKKEYYKQTYLYLNENLKKIIKEIEKESKK